MALDAKRLFTALPEMIFIVRTHGVMAAETGHILAVAHVHHPFSHRMGKLALGLMASGTDFIAVSFQKGDAIGAMHLVAIRAFADIGMRVQGLLHPLIGHLVATAAQLILSGFQEVLLIPCMWAVAFGAALAGGGEHMVMGAFALFADIGVTGKADINLIALFAMTISAALFKRGMEIVAHQSFLIAAVRAVAGQTSLHLAGKSLMSGQLVRLGVTAHTEIVRIFSEQLLPPGLMGIMTNHAVALFVRLMGHLVLFFQFIVAAQTEAGRVLPQHAFDVGDMGGMAGQAIAILDRGMDLAFAQIPPFFLVAAKTELCPLFHEQAFILCHMRIVAIRAFFFGHRGMHRLALKCLFFMALKANRLGHGDPSHHQEECRNHKSYSFTHYFFLPG